MLLLALDTSTRQASLALCDEEVLFGEYTWHVDNNHSVELLTNISRLLAECGRTMADIEGVAVATGPGSFNGLRVALTTAKSLAFALHKPLVGVSTLEVIAEQQRQWIGPICALLEAGRGELYAACYLSSTLEEDGAQQTLRRLSDYILMSPAQLGSYLRVQGNVWLGREGERIEPTYLCSGEINLDSRAALYAALQGKCRFVGNVQAARHASELAMIAARRLHAGNADDPLLLEPLYIRRPSITTSTRKKPLLGEKANRPAEESVSNLNTPEREEGALRH